MKKGLEGKKFLTPLSIDGGSLSAGTADFDGLAPDVLESMLLETIQNKA